MSGTRSPSRTARAIETPQAVLIAFGSISDPEPQDAAIVQLAADVSGKLPGWTVRGATMAAEGSITRAFEGLQSGAVIFPLLMADGWILRKVLRDALKAAGQQSTALLTPLGLLPAFRAHCAAMIRDEIASLGVAADATTVVLAAHGSARGPRPAACARALCDTLLHATGVRAVIPGYLEEAPFLADTLRAAPSPAVCLPCFVTNAHHAINDVPGAIAASGFQGQVLPAAGTVPEIVGLIADTLTDTLQTENAA